MTLSNAKLQILALVALFALLPHGRSEDRPGLDEDPVLSYGIADSIEGTATGIRYRIGSTDYMTLATSSGTLHGTSTRIGNSTFHHFTTPLGDSIRGSTRRIGDSTYTRMSSTDGGRWTSVTQSIGNVDYTTGSSRRGSFSGTRLRIGSTDYTTVRTQSGTTRATSTRIGRTTWCEFSRSNRRHGRDKR